VEMARRIARDALRDRIPRSFETRAPPCPARCRLGAGRTPARIVQAPQTGLEAKLTAMMG